MATVIEELNDKMGRLSTTGPDYQAIYGKFPFTPLAVITRSADYQCGAVANELEYARAWAKWFTETIDIEAMEGLALDKLAMLFLYLKRLPDESDANFRNRIKSLTQRMANKSWATPWAILDVFRYYFDSRQLYIMEKIVETEQMVNGDFETALGAEWTLSTGGSGTVARDTSTQFRGTGALKLTRPGGGDTAAAAQAIASVTSGVKRLNLFANGSGGNGTRYAYVYLEATISATTKRYNWKTNVWEAAAWTSDHELNLTPSSRYELYTHRVEIPSTITVNLHMVTESTGVWDADEISFGVPFVYPKFRVIVHFESSEGPGYMPLWLGGVDTLIDRGDCESTTSPMIFGETTPVLSSATWARDAAQFKFGAYSYKFTKTVAAGTAGVVHLVDNTNTNDLHGLVAGTKYSFIVRVRLPSSGGPAAGNVSLVLGDYLGSWQYTTATLVGATATWLYFYVTRTIRASATGADMYLQIASGEANGVYFNADDIRLWQGDNVDEALAGYLDVDYIAGAGGFYTFGLYVALLDMIRPRGVDGSVVYWYKG
jgi:hypothetical protein